MKRLDNNKNDFEFFDLLINDNFNDIDLIQANKDIITYMKKNNNKEDIEEIVLSFLSQFLLYLFQ